MHSDVAAASTVEGRLQRGRGQGYLDAIASPSEEVRADLLDCIVHDPRWDSQVEARADYYAELAERLSLETSAIAGHLFSSDDDRIRDENRTGLAIWVLNELAKRGRQDAVAVLRRYVVEGWNWQWALEALADLDFPHATEGLGDELERRFESDAELIEALRGATLLELWRRWAEKNPRLSRALDALKATNEQGTANQIEEPSVALLVTTATTGREDARRAALAHLGSLHAAEAIEPAELAIRNGSTELRRLGRRALFRAANPGMVPQARRWATEDNELAEVALRVLARHGDFGDVLFLRASLENAWKLGHIYGACDAVDGLGRLADRESESTIETIYDETTYSYLRRRAARALAALSEQFALGRAIESLWDCESETRLVGAASANLARDSVRHRLGEILGNPLEDASVVSVAQARRSAGDTQHRRNP
jgi:hypothetical protein